MNVVVHPWLDLLIAPGVEAFTDRDCVGAVLIDELQQLLGLQQGGGDASAERGCGGGYCVADEDESWQRDPRKALTLWANTVVDVAARVAPISAVLYAAADGDPDAAELLADEARTRMFGATAFVRYLASLDALATDISEQQAADLCWALMDGHLYQLLVTKRGWTAAAFTQWLSDCLAATLLRPS